MADKAMTFVLASASPRRLALLEQIGRKPDLIAPMDVDEAAHAGESPGHLAARLAAEKAAAAAGLHPGAVILAADTVVACGLRELPKTEDPAVARKYLAFLSGRRHRVYGGIAVRAPDGKLWQRTVVTMVKLARIEDAEIEAYLATGEWKGKAGAYGIQGAAGAFIKDINGSYTNIVGLCIYTARGLLMAAEAHAAKRAMASPST